MSRQHHHMDYRAAPPSECSHPDTTLRSDPALASRWSTRLQASRWSARLRDLSVRELVAEFEKAVDDMQPTRDSAWNLEAGIMPPRLKAARLVAELRRHHTALHRAEETTWARGSQG